MYWSQKPASIFLLANSVKLRHYSFLGIVNVTCPLDIQMSIRPLDEQKCPLDIQMSIRPLDTV